MRESGMTNTELPVYNSISTTVVAQIKIAKDGFHRMQFIRSTSIQQTPPARVYGSEQPDPGTGRWEDISLLRLLN